MLKEYNKEKLGECKIDPLNEWPSVQPKEVFEWCGMLPMWVTMFPQHPIADTLKSHMAKLYGFPLHQSKGGSVNDDGSYSYPDDPDLSPLIQFKLISGAEFLQWQFGMCAMRESAEDEWFVTRMD